MLLVVLSILLHTYRPFRGSPDRRIASAPRAVRPYPPLRITEGTLVTRCVQFVITRRTAWIRVRGIPAGLEPTSSQSRPPKLRAASAEADAARDSSDDERARSRFHCSTLAPALGEHVVGSMALVCLKLSSLSQRHRFWQGWLADSIRERCSLDQYHTIEKCDVEVRQPIVASIGIHMDVQSKNGQRCSGSRVGF